MPFVIFGHVEKCVGYILRGCASSHGATLGRQVAIASDPILHEAGKRRTGLLSSVYSCYATYETRRPVWLGKCLFPVTGLNLG